MPEEEPDLREQRGYVRASRNKFASPERSAEFLSDSASAAKGLGCVRTNVLEMARSRRKRNGDEYVHEIFLDPVVCRLILHVNCIVRKLNEAI